MGWLKRAEDKIDQILREELDDNTPEPDRTDTDNTEK